MNRIKALGNKLAFFTANLTNNRPLCFLSTCGGVRDSGIGVGFILGLEQIRQTRLFQNYDELVPGYTGMGVGVLLLIVGLIVAVTAVADKTKWTQIGLRIQAFVWLFSAIMYSLNGDLLLGLIFGMFFSIPAGYLAFYYKYAPTWAQQKKEFRDNWIKENGPVDKQSEAR